MPLRQIILDTETTGLAVADGHRMIEIACVEMIDRKLTGKYFHSFLNPEREIEAAAFAVHGISNQFLQDKPLFSHIAQELIDYISSSELIIHNAAFDVSFINHELKLAKQGWKAVTHYCSILDTLVMARQLHVGQRNSLDALCKRYGIDNSKRDLHGALLDANLLARVYLAMTGGQGSFFDAIHDQVIAQQKHQEIDAAVVVKQQYKLVILQANEDELAEHREYLEMMKKKAKPIWAEMHIDEVLK